MLQWSFASYQLRSGNAAFGLRVFAWSVAVSHSLAQNIVKLLKGHVT